MAMKLFDVPTSSGSILNRVDSFFSQEMESSDQTVKWNPDQIPLDRGQFQGIAVCCSINMWYSRETSLEERNKMATNKLNGTIFESLSKC